MLQDGTGKVAGLLNVTRLKKQDGDLVAVGKFIGTITDAAGTVTTVSKKTADPTAPSLHPLRVGISTCKTRGSSLSVVSWPSPPNPAW